MHSQDEKLEAIKAETEVMNGKVFSIYQSKKLSGDLKSVVSQASNIDMQYCLSDILNIEPR